MLVKSTFKPAWWLKSCHLQTLYPALLRKMPSPPLCRERLRTPDNDFLDLDWCGNGNHPLIILLHGLTGSSQSVYIKALQHRLLQHNFRSVALNFRGCSGEPNHSARCYHSGETTDIDFVYQTLRQRETETAFAVVGFSLGGNMLLKWLGEQMQPPALFAAVAVSVPLVLSICANKLDKGVAKLYRANLLRELKTYQRSKQRHLERSGNIQEAEKIRVLGDLSRIQSFWEYDERVVAKLYGFQSAVDYYQRSSARQFLKTIQIPTLIIQAIDDPFMTPEVIPTLAELSDKVLLEVTSAGGHVGFVAGKNPFQPHYWLEERITEFLQQRYYAQESLTREMTPQ